MKVKLIRPYFSKSIYKLYKGLPKKCEVRNPLGLMILAGVLKDKHDVEIIDGELKRLNSLIIANYCADADIIGITCTTPEFEIANELITSIKFFNPHCKIILGGPHPTIVPEECLRANRNIDFIVRFEGEETLPDLLNNLDTPESVQGIAYWKGNNIAITDNRPLLDDLDKYNADWSSIKPEFYLYPFPKEGLVPTANIAGSRGCCYHCRYCFRMFGNKVRFRDPEKIYEEMKFIKETFGITHFFFYDESFGLDRWWFEHFTMLVSKLKIKFFCMSRANLITEASVYNMKIAGLVKLSIGIESGNQDILNNEKKGITLEECVKAYNILAKHKIETRGSFILGHPNETHKTIRQSIDFAKELKLYRAAFNIMTPYPGIDILNDSGIQILNKDYSHYCRWGDSVIRTKELSPEDLKRYQRIAVKEFYLSPKVLWYHFKQFLLGEHSAYYYRPLLFAAKEVISDIQRKYSKAYIESKRQNS